MDAACLTYEGISINPVESYINLAKPVWILGKHFKPDEGMSRWVLIRSQEAEHRKVF